MKTQSEQRQEIEKLLLKYDRKIAAAFMEGIRNISDSITLKQIAEAIETGNLRTVLSIFTDALIAAGFVSFSRTLREAIIDGGDYGARIASANRVEFVFSPTESNTARFMENYQANRIKQISNDIRAQVSEILYREVGKGTNPLETARRIKSGLGLTANQEIQVENYRRYLQEGDIRALERRLRDSRFDPSIARSIREGVPLSKEKIDKIVEAYRRRYISRRAQTIARTESMTMINAGNQKYWEQAIRTGVAREKEIRRYWKHSHDSKVRSSHIQIPELNKEGRGLNEPFKSPLGLIRYPSDPASSASNRINCRCYIFIRIEKDA